jgi:hypothetical protein
MVQKGLSQGLREVFPRLGNRPFFFQRGFPLGIPTTFMVDKLLLNNELFTQGHLRRVCGYGRALSQACPSPLKALRQNRI